MARLFTSVVPDAEEVAAPRAGDELLTGPDVVTMDRAFSLPAPPPEVWPWLVQLGKRRAGWYLPRGVERFVPRSRRAARAVLARWQSLQVGDVVPDYGGKSATFEVAAIEPPTVLLYRSRRGRTELTWAITLTRLPAGGSRVHLRLRLGPVKRKWLAESAGDFFDAATIAGMAAGLRERLTPTP